MNNYFRTVLASALMLPALGSFATPPVFKPVPGGAVIGRVSDNGRWGISEDSGETEDGLPYTAGGALWDLTTMQSTPISAGSAGTAGVSDLTNDGKIVVGSYGGVPAYWNADTKAWTRLPLPAGTSGGSLLCVTPDGKKAVGYANIETEWDGVPVFYDLEADTLIPTPGIPVKDMDHQTSELSIFYTISADGRYILGRLSQHMMLPISMCAYVYDTETQTYDFIGFTPNDRRPWTPDYAPCIFIDYVDMNPKGNLVTGMAYIGNEIEGSDFLEEYYTAFKYDIAAKKTEIYDGKYDHDVAGFGLSDDGLVMVSVPAQSPYADMAIRQGDYYYTLAEIMKQAYGINMETAINSVNTGRPLSNSGDGKIISMLVGPGECYILQMNDEWADAIAKVNLLSDYNVSPANGSTFSSLESITLSFNREIGISGAASRIKLIDANGKTIQTALSTSIASQALTINFRRTALDDGKEYSVVIPDGFITMSGDANVYSSEIVLKYAGRTAEPVKNTAILPASGSSFSRLDASTNFIQVNFDAQVKIAESARAQLWKVGDENMLAEMDLALYTPSSIIVYPLSRQYLYEGSDYKVIIPAGSVTDLSGEGGNEEISINYIGNYVREVSSDDKYIFTDECQNLDGMMFFDGDKLQPADEPAGWGFNSTLPWWLTRDDETSADMALTAHSMFTTAGKADDWAVTPQLYIPDAQCYLQFDAQSYRKAKSDSLKVFVYPCENGYSTLTQEIVDDIRNNGTLVFNQRLTPGESEGSLAGEWTTYTVPLPQFAGKNVYIAFVNDNENQSAIFIHRIDVVHDMQFLTSITSSTTLVDENSAPIAGTISFISDLLVANTMELNLLSAAGDTISSIAESGLTLGKGNVYNFAFGQQLPLEKKAANRFIISILINDSIRSSVSGTVKNLAFQPTKRIVVEEYSGRDCSNCPRGFVAMENLERLYPGQIVPILLRTYEDDPLGNGMASYTNFLGINNLGAPSAAVNRKYFCYPTAVVGNDYRFSGEGTDDFTWLDAVVQEMLTYADADLDFAATYDAETGKIDIDGFTKFALNSSRNVNIFTVVLENKCYTEQLNGMRYFDDPDLGPWGKGGIYSQSTVGLEIDHVGRGSFGATFNGTPGMVPLVQEAGTENPFSFTITMPETVDNIHNTEMAILLIDSDNDQVINAKVMPIAVVNSAISEVDDDNVNAPVEYFNLQGIKISAPVKGQLLIKHQGNSSSKIIF